MLPWSRVEDRAEVQSEEPVWEYVEGVEHTVLIDGTDANATRRVVDGSQLRMVQAMVQTPALEFSKVWDPERDPPIDFFVVSCRSCLHTINVCCLSGRL